MRQAARLVWREERPRRARRPRMSGLRDRIRSLHRLPWTGGTMLL